MKEYDPHNWCDHLWDIKGSMVREIVLRVLSCAVWSVFIVCLHKYLAYLAKSPDGWAILPSGLAYSPQGHLLIGVALGLLLVFRTNSSYDRFWEGRKLWGSIINESRNLGRASSAYLAADPALVARLMHWTVAFAYATMHHLRGKKDMGPMAAVLPGDEVSAVLASNHIPLAIARAMTGQLAEARRKGLITDELLPCLDQNVQLLIDYLGGCERIHRTPVPFAYVVHLRRAMIVYCFTLPMALLDIFGWGAIPVTLIIAYTMFGIEEIGVEIEDPFGYDDNDLPLERFCRIIEGNLLPIVQPAFAPLMLPSSSAPVPADAADQPALAARIGA